MNVFLCRLTDADANQIVSLWKQSFTDAAILPVIGYPSNSNGVVTITHTVGHKMSINGLVSNSPLANNALYSSECTGNKFLNMYEIMLPDIPGTNGSPSTVQIYTRELARQGLDVAGVHFHWWGSNVAPGNTLVAAIHHQNIGMTPMEFSQRTLNALEVAMRALGH